MTDKYYVGQVVIVDGKPHSIVSEYREGAKEVFSSIRNHINTKLSEEINKKIVIISAAHSIPLQPLMLEPPKEVKPYNQRGLKNGKRKRNPNRF